VAALLAALALLVASATPAAADPVGAGEAGAFGGTVTVGGEEVIPPTPLAESDLQAEDVEETLIDIPGEPIAISGTLNADAAVHAESDIDSQLTQVDQAVEGPYNAAGVALIEGAEVLVDSLPDEVSLLTVDVIRAEAVAVCRGGEVQYSANSEVINLQLGGEDIPLNAPLSDLLDAIGDGLEESTLNQVVDIQRNVVTETEDGIAVDALVVTVLAAAGDDPLAQIRLGHAEVSGVACGTPPECSDGIDNDGDGLADADDPGCHTDGDATNPDSYDPNDDSELDEAAAPAAPGVSDNTGSPAGGSQLPATGGNAAATAGLAGAMAAGALGLVALRRRMI
jgi:LPXTG-motif cell wall-anchored protein